MKNKIVVNLADTSPASTTLTNHLPVGTRIISIFGETANTEDGQDVFTGLNAEGYISAIVLGQEHCYAVDFPLGVSVFISPVELSDNSQYQVIRRIFAHFQPQAWVNGYALDIDGDCDLDVTERLLEMSLIDIQSLDSDYYPSDELVYGMTGHIGPHKHTVKNSVLEFFGVAKLSEITEAMLMEKRLQYTVNPSSPKGKIHNVHIYAIVRVKVPNVEAESHPEAIVKAEGMVNLHSLFNKGSDQEFAEDIDCFLVDEVDDSADFTNSRWYRSDGITPLYKNQETKRDLHPYMVTLYEPIEGTETIVFKCQAEDIHHAIQQAENAYSNAKVVGAMLKLG